MAVELANDAICEDASKLLSKLSLMSHEAAEKKIEMPGETLLKLGNVTINETASLAEKTEEVIVTKMASNITQLDEKEAEKTIEGMSDEMIEEGRQRDDREEGQHDRQDTGKERDEDGR